MLFKLRAEIAEELDIPKELVGDPDGRMIRWMLDNPPIRIIRKFYTNKAE